ncbi:hypothetical protein K1719_038235 [Acacia pycnantha]|nr:hypothetical protein K1719_038235 [Acacia pycnantha]
MFSFAMVLLNFLKMMHAIASPSYENWVIPSFVCMVVVVQLNLHNIYRLTNLVVAVLDNYQLKRLWQFLQKSEPNSLWLKFAGTEYRLAAPLILLGYCTGKNF